MFERIFSGNKQKWSRTAKRWHMFSRVISGALVYIRCPQGIQRQKCHETHDLIGQNKVYQDMTLSGFFFSDPC